MPPAATTTNLFTKKHCATTWVLTLSDKMEKFFFDKNIFDEEDIEEEIVEEPPAPTFSEDELEQARKEAADTAYELGMKKGIEDTLNSIEQQTANTLDSVIHQIHPLLEEEAVREKRFEEEVIRLVLIVFTKLFPHLIEAHSQDEISLLVHEALTSQDAQTHIEISVYPSLKEHIVRHVAEVEKTIGTVERCKVIENENISIGSCQIRWQDGGALKNMNIIAEQIITHLQKLLGIDNAIPDDSAEQICENETVLDTLSDSKDVSGPQESRQEPQSTQREIEKIEATEVAQNINPVEDTKE